MALSRAGTRCAALLVAAAALAASALAADARASYRQAQEALQRQAWEEAAEHLREAIAERPEETVGPFRRYLPHYHLGRALYELGDCAGALSAWTESDRQGAIHRTREFQDLRQRRTSCREHLLKQARGEVERALRRAGTAAEAAAALRRDEALAGFWEEGTPSRADRFEEALRLVERARSALRDAPADGERLRQAAAWATGAGGRLERLAVEAEDWAGGDPRYRALAEARSLLESTAYLEPYPEVLGRARAEVEALVGSLEDTGLGDPGDPLITELAVAVERLRSAAAPPPAELMAAAAAFLAADHQAGVGRLAGAARTDPRARAHRSLLLSAARYGLWAAGGETDADLLGRARADARACRRLDPRLVPRETLFSRRFVAFFSRALGP